MRDLDNLKIFQSPTLPAAPTFIFIIAVICLPSVDPTAQRSSQEPFDLKDKSSKV